MKKILVSVLTFFVLQSSLFAQDFVVINPVMTPNPGIFPGGVIINGTVFIRKPFAFEVGNGQLIASVIDGFGAFPLNIYGLSRC